MKLNTLNNKKISNKKIPDVKANNKNQGWFYTDEVKKHFFHPRNIFMTEKDLENYKYDGLGVVGSPACGDVMKLWIKVDKKSDKIIDCKFQTFGCASAIASTSILTVMVTEKGGMKLDEALKLKPQDITKRLKGLPDRKIHCSVLGDKALRAAINDYFRKSGQINRIFQEGAKTIDKVLKITDKDIEYAVLDGATTFEDLQKKTKIGIHDKNCIPEAKELLEYFKKIHFGT
ncbi:MAG: iron-sulfur cluster assembly scaffold protein [Candidatus Woesearchaeota archaeon]